MFRAVFAAILVISTTVGADDKSPNSKDTPNVAARASTGTPSGEPQLEIHPIAHWSFNEADNTAHVRNISGREGLDSQANQKLPRGSGVHGNALDLSGSYQMPVNIGRITRELKQVTFSAWTQPVELSGYREIFRQECPTRLLFSYQHNGTILSLGLNIGGYVECDAEIQPGRVLDGQWHHCAATFDGQMMRVYLDGKLIGSLERPGTIATQPEAPAFIGSSGGRGEFFQGGIDDLRIYDKPLSPEDINTLYRTGLDSIATFSKELEQRVHTLCGQGDTFAEMLANSRRNIIEQEADVDRTLASALLARLKARFPGDYDTFVTVTGSSPADFLASKDDGYRQTQAERLVALLTEYKPLTQGQWDRVAPAEREHWKRVEALEARYKQLLEGSTDGKFSADWITVLLEAGKHIHFRPKAREAVAPFVIPSTPATAALSDEAATATLERDWLFQADQNPSRERIHQEIQWARQMAQRIATQASGDIDFAPELQQLADLENKAAGLSAPDTELYFQVRRVKRSLQFRNPVIDFDEILFVDMPFPQGSEWPHETRHRLGYMAVPGARLIALKGLSPRGIPRQLMPQAPLHGSFWRPDVSYDGKKVLFCFKPHNEKAFHLYEINADGSGLVQLTSGIHDDLDPIYLPDGEHILFSTSRSHTYVRCMPPTNAYVLARCNRDGSGIYLVSRNNEPDYLPSVMNDGRVIYTRWEYTDKPLWRAQALWTVNPDGTQVNTFWGNQTVWPDLLKDARNIPGSRRVIFTGSAHHNWFSGSVGILDPMQGFNFPDGLTKVTADVAWPESGNGPIDPIESPNYHASGKYTAYYSPYPLGEQDFLVSANRNGKFLLYLMDADGNRELLYEGTNNIFHAIPLRPRRRPPLIPDRVAWPSDKERLTPASGIIYSNDVYHGAPKVLQGKAKYLRVLNIDPKTYTYWHKRPYISTGPVVSMVQSEGVKRVLGTVPIERDGSVAFHAPSGMALHFQLLDEQYRALHTMRSFTGVMPGETRGCLGCHESHSRAPHQVNKKTIAWGTEPREITPPPWEDNTVSYARYVQPVLDQYCGKCHEGDGEAVETLDLTRRPGFLMFDEPYVTLTGRPAWGQPYTSPEDAPPGFGIAKPLMVEGYGKTDPQAYQTPPPMTALSYKSPLIDLASSGKHYDVRVDPVNLRRLTVWIDTMCPFRGEEEVRSIPDPEFQGVDWLSIRPRIHTAPKVIRPGPID